MALPLSSYEPVGDTPPRRFVRGKLSPRGVAWFSVREFWGHLFHFVASAIATEDIDSRDWMQPDRPDDLAAQIVRRLGGRYYRGNLLDSLERELWIDYVADTGDDVSVSGAVAKLLFEDYQLPDPEAPGALLVAARGELLIFGGDTAYPVATADEINERVVVPYNRVLKGKRDRKNRVLLGVPGNHDWYDGLDGFGRLFRRREEAVERSMRADSAKLRKRTLNYYAEWAKEFVRGGRMQKPKALLLDGYQPLQQASYFSLPLTPHLQLFGIDRQLRDVDFRQREFFVDLLRKHPERGRWLMLPDPVAAFGQPSPSGEAMISALSVDLNAHPHLVLSGDIHHYRRWEQGPSMHVVAGGGGAFLHPAPVHRKAQRARVEWPGPRQSRSLLWRVPGHIAIGKSGTLPHLALLGAYLGVWAGEGQGESFWSRYGAGCALAIAAWVTFALIGGVRRRGAVVWVLAAGCAATCALLPYGVSFLLKQAALMVGRVWPWPFELGLTALLSVLGGAWAFGTYLMLLTRLGIENTQAFTALGHPGFKHFMRFRVRRDGRTVDGWCLGLIDPLNEAEPPVLVDHFTWRS